MRRRALLLVAAATLALCTAIGAGAAYGYFTSSGSGSGSASTGTVTLTTNVMAGSGLYPGGSVSVIVKLNNTSASAALTISSLSQNGSATVQTAGKGTCTPSVVTFTAGSLPGNPVGAGSFANVSGTVSMTSAALDGCQGTTFSIPLIATGKTS
jgi:hypothetical protein